jgi:hypothetical protein
MGTDDVKLCTVPYVELSGFVNKMGTFLYTGIIASGQRGQFVKVTLMRPGVRMCPK